MTELSVTYVSAELRRLVLERACGRCEYCRIDSSDTFFGLEIDHIISEKHGGPTTADNLAAACACCNQAKGSDVGSIHLPSGEFVRFFHPRQDGWSAHFVCRGVRLEGITPIGEATARILGFNNPERLLERAALMAVGRWQADDDS